MRHLAPAARDEVSKDPKECGCAHWPDDIRNACSIFLRRDGGPASRRNHDTAGGCWPRIVVWVTKEEKESTVT